jgi:hypothetical protein
MRTLRLEKRQADLPLFPDEDSEEEPNTPDEDRVSDDGEGGASPDELWPPGDEPEEVIDDDPEPRR